MIPARSHSGKGKIVESVKRGFQGLEGGWNEWENTDGFQGNGPIL